MTETDIIPVELDIAVIGGGIAGLWLTQRLVNQGYDCALLEAKALGSEQTVASQGMIHGGLKYTLSGKLTGASETVADMPGYWRRCLAGEGDVDLRDAKLLSDEFYFWSDGGVGSRLSTFFASKAVHGRINKLKRDDYPSLLASPQFRGQVYRLQDIVLDVPSVLEALRAPISDRVLLLPRRCYWSRDQQGLAHVSIPLEDKTLEVRAKRFIFTAGKGNGALLKQLGASSPAMQLRPLHQVWVKHSLPHKFFGHCLGPDSTPRLSISTHPAADGRLVWSLGGQLAEQGVDQSPDALVATAQKEMRQLFPWLDLSEADWLPVRIDRAEAKQKQMMRPDKAIVAAADSPANVLAAWPTKLTLAPNLANETLALLKQHNIVPSERREWQKLSSKLSRPFIATPPWD